MFEASGLVAPPNTQSSLVSEGLGKIQTLNNSRIIRIKNANFALVHL